MGGWGRQEPPVAIALTLPSSPVSHQTRFDTTHTAKLVPGLSGVRCNPCVPNPVSVRSYEVMAPHRRHQLPSPTSSSTFRAAVEHVSPWSSIAERVTARQHQRTTTLATPCPAKETPPTQIYLQPLCAHRRQGPGLPRAALNHPVNAPLAWSRLYRRLLQRHFQSPFVPRPKFADPRDEGGEAKTRPRP